MRVLVASGPNLSQLGTRDPAVYGADTLEQLIAVAREELQELTGDQHDVVEGFATDAEGELVARLHAARNDGTDALIINPGALTHYSYALRDALELINVPKVEVHLSQTAAREPFRRTSVVSPVVDVTITGAGAYGYRLAVRAVVERARA